MRSFKLGNHNILTLSVFVLLIIVTYAYGATTTSSSPSPSVLSSSASLMHSGQRKLSQPANGDFDITRYIKGGSSGRNRGSKSLGSNKRRGGSKRNGRSKKNKHGGGKNSRNPDKLHFTKSCECGKKFTNRIIGGVPATRNEYPWQVALFELGAFTCGGTLINNRFVLTAAHCVYMVAAADVTVRLREYSLSMADQPKEIVKSIATIIMHKDYKNSTTENDIALLKLDKKIEFPKSAFLRPICLPSTTSELYVDETAIATGWGVTGSQANGTRPSDVLMEVEIEVVSEEDCKVFFPAGRVKDTNICAGNPNADTCNGDSGGPLAYENSADRYEQIGITSFGYKCGVIHSGPGVYTRVTKYLSWIKRKTRSATYCRGFTFP